MKNLIVHLMILFVTTNVVSAQTKMKDGTITSSSLPNANAILELESNNKGFLLPRLNLTNTTSFAPLTQHVQGLLVYNTALTADVIPGIYLNDGTKWNLVKSNADINIYNNDGSFTSARTANMNGNILNFVGTDQRIMIGANGMLSIHEVGTSTRSAIGLHINGQGNLWLFADENNTAQVVSGGNATALLIGSGAAANPTPIIFSTTNGSQNPGTDKARIEGDGRFTIMQNLAVGFGTPQTFTGSERLLVNGSITTASTNYADYVFEQYYKGYSNIKNDYQFYSIYDIEKFIRENKHLPGIKSIHQLNKTEDGKYMINATELSIQSLEKIEELFLHTIEQQKQIDALKNQIEEIKELLIKTSEITVKN